MLAPQHAHPPHLCIARCARCADSAALKLGKQEEQLDVLAAILAASEEEAKGAQEADDLTDDVNVARKCVGWLGGLGA